MVISNLNIKLIEDRLGFINKAAAKLKRLSFLEEQAFLYNDNPAIAESYLRRALEAVFDIGRHIIARTAAKGVVEYKEVARALGNNGVISDASAAKLILMAGYSSRLIHLYHEIEDRKLYTIVRDHLGDSENFGREIKEFLRNFPK
jgi:uncharacterized protein YutE (UPF0331/DUF86 family)